MGFMKVILAEKPSVARDIAKVWGIDQKKDGYIEGKGCAITWAFGHLVTLEEPAAYDPKLRRWDLNSLPFVPEHFKLKLIGNQGVDKQFATIKRLFEEADEVICATDAGREGELIFRYILELTGCQDKNIRRLWLSSLTPEAIKEAFGALKDGHEYDNLFEAARCRSESDWIVGLNATRFFTVRYGNSGGCNRVLWSVGRVQTPVLAMIVHREDEIAAFRPEPFWELVTTYRDVAFRFTGDRFTKQEKAAELLQKIQEADFTVTKVGGRKKTEKPPQLFDLTTLQREMNKRFGFSAAKTLRITQKLYEEKLLTYPRTDSRYLSKDMQPRIAPLLEKLRPIRQEEIGRMDLGKLPFTSRIIDDKKITDHHAIIPTGMLPRGGQDADEQKLFGAVVNQLIASLYPDCIKRITTVDGQSAEVPFQAKGTVIESPGWTQLFPKDKRKKGDDDQELPAFTKGETGPHQPAMREGKTKPPNFFTENSLLGAMESAGKFVDDDALREALKERGIGTPATRAAIIETLIKRNYIWRDKKRIRATDMGRYLIALIKSDLLKSPEMTGEWEQELKSIEHGEASPDQFMGKIGDYTKELIEQGRSFRVNPRRWGSCPLCGKELMAGKKGIGCSGWKEGCDFVIWREYKGLTLHDATLQELLQQRILLRPVEIPDRGTAILYLTHTGAVLDIDLPNSNAQKN